MMKALGMIETRGLLAAIESADAMLKAADVALLEKNLAGGGLVTISVAGEVAAVQAAVDAAALSVGRIAGATLVSRHVIARPDAGLAAVLALAAPPAPKAPASKAGVQKPGTRRAAKPKSKS
jgi:microcompartment protein CcmL/EutN